MNHASGFGVRTPVLVISLALAGCASVPPPDAQMTAARAAVIQAEPVAHRYAPAELRLAQEKLARAEQAIAREEWTEARRLAEQAEVDARLAWSVAENERSRNAR